MSLRIKCPGCQSALQVPDSARGKQVRCSNCQQTLKIPAAQSASKPAAPAKSPASPLQIKCPGCQTTLRLQASMAGKVVRCTQCQTQLKVPAPKSSNRPSAAPRQPPATAQPSDMFAGLPTAAPTPGRASGGAFAGTPSRRPAPRGAAPANRYAASSRSSSASRPQSSGGTGTLPSGRSPALYIVPAVIMMIWGGLIIVAGLFQMGLIIFLLATGEVDMQQVDTAQLVGQIAGQFLAIALQVAVVSGSVSMMRRTNLSSARAAAVITTIPCFGCIFFPIGIWACVLLFSQQAERDFS